LTNKKLENNRKEIKIGVSKRKALFQILIVVGLLTISVWGLTKTIVMPTGFDRSFLLTGISFLTIVFGLSCISGFRKIMDNELGLIINDSGIQINIGPNRGEFVRWSEITDFKIHGQYQGNLFLLLFVKNPEKYLKDTTGLKRLQVLLNNKSHKTPVSITTNWLKCSIEELTEIIDEKIKNGV
jgi:hypothetical protein